MISTLGEKMQVSPLAGKPADPSMLVDIPKLITAYFNDVPDPNLKEERIQFGTSGHRGSSFKRSFNENHILAISQAIADWRKNENIDGPLYIGVDTHALSFPALVTAVKVLTGNGVRVILSKGDPFTPTPVISHAILSYNRGKKEHLADGIVITPSHNPPDEGGFKYNPPNGGPAEVSQTSWIQQRANEYLKNGLKGIKKSDFDEANSSIERADFKTPYIEDLKNVIDMDIIRESNLKFAVDPLGGAGIHYWREIKEAYGLNLTILSEEFDPTFRFMTLDWDGKIRMDPSSPYAMQRIIGLKEDYPLVIACDTDHDRHGIVTKSSGLLQPNHYLTAAIYYLFQHRPKWKESAEVGKTVVSSQMIDLVTKKLGRKLYEVPVGFKWFVEGLFSGDLAFVGEESAGASFTRFDGSVWTTDKDGIILGLLAAEMTARMKKDPGEIYQELTKEFGSPAYIRLDAPATPEQKDSLKKLKKEDVHLTSLGEERIEQILTEAPGNLAPIGGIKIQAKSGWIALRPSGTEDVYKIYAESFLGKKHLDLLLKDAKSIVDGFLVKI